MSDLDLHEMSQQLKILYAMLFELIEKKFYGSFTIKFENGKIIICKKEETIKL
mgnify:FL=1